MRLKKLAEAMLWLPGFAPGEDPLEVLGEAGAAAPTAPEATPATASILPFRPRRQEKAEAPPMPWPGIPDGVHADLGGQVAKFVANCNAIEVLRAIEAEGRAPTDAERVTLLRYTGWGGLSQAFNEAHSDESWRLRAQQLKALLSDEEYESARASTPNAHYTDVEVIRAIWEGVERLGFNGGRVLEPSAGTGLFLGAMPEALAQASAITAVELDSISARICRTLYGPLGVRVLQQGFEATQLEPGSYDLVISNVPFGDYAVPELRHVPYRNWSIHNYFLAKSLEVVRDGGLVVVITSSYFLDSAGKEVREALAAQAELVTAVRLPCQTFKAIANTEVTTDLLVFRKAANAGPAPSWAGSMKPVPKESPLRPETLPYWISPPVNPYYLEHPSCAIGTLVECKVSYGKRYGLSYDGNVAAALRERVAMWPTGAFKPARAANSPSKPRPETVKLEHAVKPGSHILVDGKLAISEGSSATLIEDRIPGKTAQRIRGMMAIRDAARKLISVQASVEDDLRVEPYRVALNGTYEGYVAKFGVLHERGNRLAFRTDPDYPLLLALEHWDEETGKARKADLFYRRTVGVVTRVTSSETAQDALVVSLAETGRVDVGRMAELLSADPSEFLPELEEEGAIFFEPDERRWVPRDEYLSGNVRAKLRIAEASGPRFARHVQALREALPEDIGPGDIGIRLGASWVPAEVYETWLKERIGHSVKVSYNALVATWSIDAGYSAPRSVEATREHGTPRVDAYTLVEQAMNAQIPKVTDPDPEESSKRVVNVEATVAAKEKQSALKEHFVQWVWQDAERASKLVRLYNDAFNSIVPRVYDGSHLQLPGFSNCYTPHRHQLNAIWRQMVSAGNTLLAHVVGAGKTLSMICAAMELRRIGRVRKPCIVVPNHMLEQFGAEMLRAYPGANVLLFSKDDLCEERRKTMLARIATGDWDAVITTHSVFERIQVAPEVMKAFIKEEILQLIVAIKSEGQQNKRTIKELEKAKRRWESKLQKLGSSKPKDDHLTFDQLGIDLLMCDEAHLFKNLFRFTKMTRIAGLPNSDAARAFDMFVKTRLVMQEHGKQWGVVFATGTPVANSVAELWTMQRYLQPETLDAHDLSSFDGWAGNFGEVVTSVELAPDGSGYRLNDRFARFINVPELMAMFREVADIQTAEMVNLPVPEAIRETVVAPCHPVLKAYVEGLVERAEAIRDRRVTPAEDNMLAVTNDGRLAATDLRLVGFEVDPPDSKVNQCVEKVFEVWKRSAETLGAQLVFLDKSTPKGNRWSLYGDIRKKLVDRGVPETEIAFIHDADSDSAKAKLFAKVRDGKVRVMIGSTEKMGCGTNVQTRLVALHHLDAPWRPADVEQREGRIVRQGNTNRCVAIYRYVTEGSFDAYMWQTLETKAKFIAQVWSGDTSIRSAEDLELAALSYAEVKALASGNPMVIEKAGVDAEFAKLSLLYSDWRKQRWEMQQDTLRIPENIATEEGRAQAIESDIALRDRSGSAPITVAGVAYEKPQAFAEAVREACLRLRAGAPRVIGSFHGFDLVGAVRHIAGNRYPEVWLRGAGSYEVQRVNGGLAGRLAGELGGLEDRLADSRARCSHLGKRLAQTKELLSTSWEHQSRYEQVLARKREIDQELGIHSGAEADGLEEAAEAA